MLRYDQIVMKTEHSGLYLMLYNLRKKSFLLFDCA